MNQRTIIKSYYNWLVNFVCNEEQSKSYSRLLDALFNKEFRWSIRNDENRAVDGMNLRQQFANERYTNARSVIDILDNIPCNVLEVLIAMAIRFDDEIISYGHDKSRTDEWFWLMIANMSIDEQCNEAFDDDFVDDCLNIMLDRKYKPDGSGGGIFIVSCPRRDMRETELWYQMHWYLNEIN